MTISKEQARLALRDMILLAERHRDRQTNKKAEQALSALLAELAEFNRKWLANVDLLSGAPAEVGTRGEWVHAAETNERLYHAARQREDVQQARAQKAEQVLREAARWVGTSSKEMVLVHAVLATTAEGCKVPRCFVCQKEADDRLVASSPPGHVFPPDGRYCLRPWCGKSPYKPDEPCVDQSKEVAP